MDIKVDARGMACPKPVIMTKNQLDELEKGQITTIVDNKIAKENVSKLANSLGYEYEIDKKNENEYHIHIVKGESILLVNNRGEEEIENAVIAFSSDKMGEGSDELGRILMKSFIYTVTEVSPHPSALIFYNGGVYLTCKDSEVLEDLQALEAKGVEIISCGTCLDYFGIKDDLQVGEISNMYTIYEKLKESDKILPIG